MAVLIDGRVIHSEIVLHERWIEYEAIRAVMKVERCDKHEAIKDCKQEGYIALLKSVATYDTDRGATLYTWAYKRVRGAMYDWFRSKLHSRVKRPPQWVEIDDPDYYPGRKFTYNESLELLCDLEKLIWPDNPRHVKLIEKMVSGDGLTEAGASIGVSQSRACQIMQSFRHANNWIQ